jgi:hypothetical protein
MQETEGQQAKVVRRKSPTEGKQERVDSATFARDCEDVILLKKEISRLEAGNKANCEIDQQWKSADTIPFRFCSRAATQFLQIQQHSSLDGKRDGRG